MFGISPFGMLHTLIGLAAVIAGYTLLIRDGAIGPRSLLGRSYIVATVITCVTGFFIFRHGGFGVAHGLGVLTLGMLALAWWAGRSRATGGVRPYVEVLAYTSTLFFHMVPGLVETTTRLPVGRPLASGPDDPWLQTVLGVTLGVFALIGAAQVWHLRRRARRSGPVVLAR